jgi:hypothetical protein
MNIGGICIVFDWASIFGSAFGVALVIFLLVGLPMLAFLRWASAGDSRVYAAQQSDPEPQTCDGYDGGSTYNGDGGGDGGGGGNHYKQLPPGNYPRLRGKN